MNVFAVILCLLVSVVENWPVMMVALFYIRRLLQSH